MAKFKVLFLRIVFDFIFVLFFVFIDRTAVTAGELGSEANPTVDCHLSLEQFISLRPTYIAPVNMEFLSEHQPRLKQRERKLNTISENFKIRNTISALDLTPHRPLIEVPLTTISPPGNLRKDRLLLASSGLTLANWYLYQQFRNIWWSHNRTDFHFYRGWRRTTGWWDMGPDDSLWFHMDKLGHMYNARLVSRTVSDIGHWVGLTDNQSTWAGAILSSAFYLEIELFDGHYEEWGFSMGDFIASEIGAFLPMISNRFPQMDYFTLKWSYHSSPEINNEHYLIEDYAGMTFWLSSDVWGLLPRSLKKFWPPWLNLAFGYGVTQKAYGEIELYLALDYNLTKMSIGNPTVRKLLQYLNYIHLPAPTLQFRPMVKTHWLYF